MSLAADKSGLRARMRARRRALQHALPGAAQAAADRAPLEALAPFRTVAGYWPLGSELDPRPLLARFAGAGARLALPVAERLDAPLAFRAWAPGDPLEPDAAGVPSPAAGAPHVTPDLVIAPMLAFDRQGRRLGQGGGHYDRTLANLRASRPVFVLGLAFSGQALDEVPAEPHDQRMDAVLTEAEFIRIGG